MQGGIAKKIIGKLKLTIVKLKSGLWKIKNMLNQYVEMQRGNLKVLPK